MRRLSILTLAYFVLIEAWRSRFFLILIGLLLIAWSGSLFLAAIAITETRELQVSVLALFLRLAAVYTVSLFVISSLVREFQEQGMALYLASSMPRYQYFLGKLLGFASLALLVALSIDGLLSFYSSSLLAALSWSLSLWGELLIMLTLGLLLVLRLPNILQAGSVLLGFYLLARNITAIQLMASSTLHTQHWYDLLLQFVVKVIAWLLPNLAEFTRTDWLVYAGINGQDGARLIVQTLIYLLLLSSVGLFDLYRKNL